MISLQRCSVQSSMSISESMSNVNHSFSSICNIFDRPLVRAAGHHHDQGSCTGAQCVPVSDAIP